MVSTEPPPQPPPGIPRSRLRSTPTRIAAALLAGLALAALAVTSGTGEIRCQGRRIEMPLPYGSLQIASSEGRSSYLMLGYPDLHGAVARRGEALGWGETDQLGSMYHIYSSSNERLRLSALTELETRFFTRVDFRVEEEAAP
jgi:hypothetical protein